MTAILDPATLGPPDDVAPDTASYSGGIAGASFTLNGVTVSTGAGKAASVLATAVDTPPVLGIPGFYDGYRFAVGGPAGQEGRRFGINLLFAGAAGGLPNLSPLESLPGIDGFGARLDSVATVPAPPAFWLLAGLGGLVLQRCHRRCGPATGLPRLGGHQLPRRGRQRCLCRLQRLVAGKR